MLEKYLKIVNYFWVYDEPDYDRGWDGWKFGKEPDGVLTQQGTYRKWRRPTFAEFLEQNEIAWVNLIP